MSIPETLKLRHCGKCGTALSRYAPEGLCAACLLESAFTEEAGHVKQTKTAPLLSFDDYELFEEIARGGMGVVYRARQISLNRVVAVKMILTGQLANAAEVQRFKAEAETAAHLRHPNIVAIHEVGAHNGQPFFTMDYVEGRSLAELAQNGPLPARLAARYLKTIADAVQYAHSRGVLHRDLKPSNILIDAVDQPRITDFGLAKRYGVPVGVQPLGCPGRPEEPDRLKPALQPDLTLTGQMLGSPNFMPPEQVTYDRRNLGPASDVYSLGAVLYQLLTGRPPFVAETMTQTLRLVAETEPVSPRLLNASVPRDLETICLKCLQKEPLRRYASAQELADDLNRFLRDEPIHARPIGPAARMWRWCRRNHALAATGAAVVLLLLAVSIGSPIAAFRINSARQQAEADKKIAQTEAIKSQQVAGFLKDMLHGVKPSVAKGRDPTMLREILDRTAERIGKDLTDQPEVEIELRTILCQTYEELGLYKQMEEMARESLRVSRSRLGDEHPAVANSLQQLGMALMRLGKMNEAETISRQALTMLRRLFGNDHPALIEALQNLAHILKIQQKLEESQELHREALTLSRKLFGREHRAVSSSLFSLALLLRWERKLDESESMHREALAMQRKLLGNEHVDVAESLNCLAHVLWLEGKLAEGETMGREALALYKKLLGREHPNVAQSLNDLAQVLESLGKVPEAETMGREALVMRRKLLGDQHPSVRHSLNMLVHVFYTGGKLAEIEALYREMAEGGNAQALNNLAWLLATCDDSKIRDGRAAVSFAEKAAAATNRKDSQILDTLAAAYAEAGEFAKAVRVQQEAIGVAENEQWKKEFAARLKLYQSNAPYRQREPNALTALGDFAGLESLQREQLQNTRAQLPADEPRLANALAALTRTLLVEEKFAEAEPLAREGLTLREKNLPDDWMTFNARSLLGGSLLGQKRYAEAEPLLISGHGGMKQREVKIPADSKPLKEALQRLIQLYEATGQSDKVADWKQKLDEIAQVGAGKKVTAPEAPDNLNRKP